MLLRHFFVIIGVITFLACKTFGTQADSEVLSNDPSVNCEIVIIGGGVAGLHTAYRLGPEYGRKICLFEKENRLGGRIYDITKSPEQLNGPFIAVGGRRVMDGQSVVINLAKELDIELEAPEIDAELCYARGMYSVRLDDFIKVYPTIDVDRSKGDFAGQLYQRLLKSPERRRVDQFPNLKTYVIKVVGKEGYNFLRDTYRFRADFEYNISARAYLDYLEEELNAGAICPRGDCRLLYPTGGMSAYVRGLEKKARSYGVRIFLSEPVIKLDKEDDRYLVETSQHKIQAKKLIISVPPHAFAKIKGSIAESIQKQAEFQALVPVRVTSISQWYDEPWWRGALTKDGREIWRAWTTDSCINSIEIPQEQYAAKQNVIRVVYNDQLECVEKWSKLAQGPLSEMEQEIAKGLNQLFANNKVTTPVKIGKPTKTVYWEWPDAWYYISGASKFTNRDIYNWAVEPLPGEDVALVSEGYNPQRSAWTDAAYKSSIHYLKKRMGMNLSGIQD